MKKLSAVLLLILAVALAGPAMAATATLTWTAPTTNTDGTPLTDLAGYKVYVSATVDGTYALIGTVAAATTTYTDTVTVPNNTITRRYYVVTAFDGAGNESAYSNQAVKSFFGVDTIGPKAPTNLTVQ